MRNLSKLTFLILCAQGIFSSEAFAVSKLSSWLNSIKPQLITAEDYVLSNLENVNGVITEVNRYKMMYENGELLEMAKQYGMDKADAYIQGVAAQNNVDLDKVKGGIATAQQVKTLYENGELDDYAMQYGMDKAQAYAQPYINKFSSKLLAEQNKLLASIQAKKNDYLASLKAKQNQKNQQIDEQLNELNVKVQDENLTENEHQQVVEEIASLEAQKQQNLDQQLEADPTYKGLEAEEQKAEEEMRKLSSEEEQKALGAALEEQSKGLFADEHQDEDNQAIYQTEIEALFLKEDEESTSENLARIKKNRKREYYNALQKAMEISVLSAANSPEIEENLNNYMQMSGEVEGNFAVKNADVGVVIESAKAAAGLTEALLAEIRLKTTQDMVSWNNKNRLYDYKKSLTEFDFDSYALKKEDLKTKAKELYEKNKDKIDGLYNQGADKAKDMWHKL